MGREEAKSPLFGLQSDPVPRSCSNQKAGWTREVLL